MTTVKIERSELSINHRQKIMLLGSCFAEEVGKRMREDGFNCLVNPFGELYNPLSVIHALDVLMSGESVQPCDLFYHDGLWHSWLFHGRFSHSDQAVALQQMNDSLAQAREYLKGLDVLVLTWGTTRCYYYNDKLVANCHKMPQKFFTSEDATQAVVTEFMQDTMTRLHKFTRYVQVLMTVSPIRYVSYGLHESQLSKATLLLSADWLCKVYDGCMHYFPAYEIVMDELRDYRFYAEDMAHPSAQAVQYVYERFCDTYLSKEEQQLSLDVRRVMRDMRHRPLHPDSPECQHFLEQLEERKNKLKQQYPHLKFE